MRRHPQAVRLDRLNLVPIALGMGLAWITPMLQFWGAAFGPLKPFHYPVVDTAPPLWLFLLCASLCFVPCALGERFYRPRTDLRRLRLYERLGVRFFKRYTPSGDYINRHLRRRDPAHRILRDGAAVASFMKGSLSGERAHFVLLLMGLFTSAYALRIGWYGWFWVLTVGNVVANLYPCLLQRYNRARVLRVARRLRPTGSTRDHVAELSATPAG